MEFQTFPHTTKPSSYSNLTSFQYSTATSQPIFLQNSEPSTSTSSQQQPDGDEDEVFGELTRVLFDCLEKVDNVQQKRLLFRKIFVELEKESQMENFIVEKLKHSQVKIISEILERHLEIVLKCDHQKETVSRGFKEEDFASKSKFSHKLERFKVKTIWIEGGMIKK